MTERWDAHIFAIPCCNSSFCEPLSKMKIKSKLNQSELLSGIIMVVMVSAFLGMFSWIQNSKPWECFNLVFTYTVAQYGFPILYSCFWLFPLPQMKEEALILLLPQISSNHFLLKIIWLMKRSRNYRSWHIFITLGFYLNYSNYL